MRVKDSRFPYLASITILQPGLLGGPINFRRHPGSLLCVNPICGLIRQSCGHGIYFEKPIPCSSGVPGLSDVYRLKIQ